MLRFQNKNERGDGLIKSAQIQRLKIVNTYYKENKNSRWVWLTSNSKTRNEIDSILADNLNAYARYSGDQ
jgi:hypothetical protein